MGGDGLDIEELLDYLMQRCERKIEIEDDRIVSPEHDVARLEEIVVDFEWN